MSMAAAGCWVLQAQMESLGSGGLRASGPRTFPCPPGQECQSCTLCISINHQHCYSVNPGRVSLTPVLYTPYPCSARNSCPQSYGVWTSQNKVHLIGPIIFLQRQSLSDQASASLCQWKYTCLIISIFQRTSKAADERNLLQKLTANRVKSPNVQREEAVIPSCVQGPAMLCSALKEGVWLLLWKGRLLGNGWIHVTKEGFLELRAFRASSLLRQDKMLYPAADTCTHKRHSPLPRLSRCVSSSIWEQFSSIIIFILRSLPSLTVYFPSVGVVCIVSKNLLLPCQAHSLTCSCVVISRAHCSSSCPRIAHCSPAAPGSPGIFYPQLASVVLGMGVSWDSILFSLGAKCWNLKGNTSFFPLTELKTIPYHFYPT